MILLLSAFHLNFHSFVFAGFEQSSFIFRWQLMMSFLQLLAAAVSEKPNQWKLPSLLTSESILSVRTATLEKSCKCPTEGKDKSLMSSAVVIVYHLELFLLPCVIVSNWKMAISVVLTLSTNSLKRSCKQESSKFDAVHTHTVTLRCMQAAVHHQNWLSDIPSCLSCYGVIFRWWWWRQWISLVWCLSG